MPLPNRRLLGIVLALCASGALAGVLLWKPGAERLGRGPAHGHRPGAGRVAEVADLARPGRPVLFVGLDGGDWELLDRYVAAGVMPNLAALAREGASGILETIQPPLSPLVWTTMTTGRSPLDHGILDFTRFHPGNRQKEPITSDERREPAIWNMATYGGRSVAVFGLWATYPAESVNGLVVSDRLFSFLYSEDTPPPGSVFPPDREPWAQEALGRAEKAVGLSEMKEYLPWLTDAEYAQRRRAQEPYAHPVSALRRILLETRVYHELASTTIARDRPDLAVVYVQGTDSLGHVFAPFAPPHQPEVSEEDFRRYQDVPEKYFRHIDSLLGEYRRLAEANGAVLMLASDHGFLWSEGRPTGLSSFAHATAAKWHRNEGMYLLWGSGIAAGAGERGRGGVEQICPTLLAILGLPEIESVDVKPLLPVAASGTRVDYRPHYRPAALASATAPAAADQESLEKLKALGYVGSGEAAAAPKAAAGSTRTAGSYNNEALLWRNKGKNDKAAAAWEKALELDPNLASALWNLSDLVFGEGKDLDRADALLLRAFANGLPEGPKFLIGRAIGYQRSGRAERSLRLVRQALESRPDIASLWLFSGRYRVELGDCRGAVGDFEKAIVAAPQDAAAHASLGMARLCLGDARAARQDLLRSLQLDPDQPNVRAYLKTL